MVTLVVLAGSATAKEPAAMTLAQAKRMSAPQLAEQLLGKADAAGYMEADVQGNCGIMIHMPGLNGIDLYQRPKASGFQGMCQVNGVKFNFETSRHDTPGDPPHKVRNWWKFTRFAMLASPADDPDRACAALAPVIGRTDPELFAVASDKAADAYFAMRMVAKAQAVAPTIRSALTCEAYDEDKAFCIDPALAIKSVPIPNIFFVDVRGCSDGRGQCVHAIWEKEKLGKDSRRVELEIRTDATSVNGASDPNILAIKVQSGIWIFD